VSAVPGRWSYQLTAATVAAVSLLLSGCSEAVPSIGPPAPTTDGATSAGEPSAAATSAPTSSSAVPLSAEDQALAEATEAVKALYAAMDRINADPNLDADPELREVTSGDAYMGQMRMAVQMKARGLTQIGSARVVDATPISVDLTTDTTVNPPKFPIVVIDACLDVGDVNVVDVEGGSVVPADRLDQTTARLDVVHFDFGWRVHQVASSGEPCAP
jgi:hypothetical protein